MTTSKHSEQQRPSATIYQFPVGGRAAVVARRTSKSNDPREHNYPAVDFGAGWYHDEAIQDAKRTYEH